VQPSQPLFQEVGLGAVLPAQPLDPEPDLADGQGVHGWWPVMLAGGVPSQGPGRVGFDGGCE